MFQARSCLPRIRGKYRPDAPGYKPAWGVWSLSPTQTQRSSSLAGSSGLWGPGWSTAGRERRRAPEPFCIYRAGYWRPANAIRALRWPKGRPRDCWRSRWARCPKIHSNPLVRLAPGEGPPGECAEVGRASAARGHPQHPAGAWPAVKFGMVDLRWPLGAALLGLVLHSLFWHGLN